MYDNDIEYLGFDICKDLADAYDDGFEDGMSEIIRLVNEFKNANKESFAYWIILDLKEYIEENRLRKKV